MIWAPKSEEAAQGAQFGLIVVLVGGRAEFDFLDLHHFLTGLHFLRLFLFLIAELAVIHQAADRGLRVRCDFHQIHIGLFGHAQRFGCTDNTDLGAVDAGQSDLRNPDLAVDPVIAILSYDTTPQCFF